MRHSSRTFCASQWGRRGNSAAVVAVALGLFAAVAGFLFYQHQLIVTQEQNAALQQSELTEAARLQTLAERRASESAVQAAAVAPAPTSSTIVAGGVELVDDEDVRPAEATIVTPAEAAETEGPDVETLVNEHLLVGEFGPAMELARAVPDAALRNALLQQIAGAQLRSGEYTAALLAVRQMDESGMDVVAAEPAAPEQESFAGGNPFAAQGFQVLQTLIQEQTSGPWFEIDGDGGVISQYGMSTGGISVDPAGVMHNVTRQERDQRLALLGQQVRDALLDGDLGEETELRLLSLTRLEREVARRLEEGLPIVKSMKYLGGLTAVRYVFVYPEDGEIVLGGPAEPWTYTADGLAVGKVSGRPVLQLDDLVTVLRTFSHEGDGIFTCSIDPRQEGLKRVHDFLQATNGKPLRPSAVGARVRKFQELLGLQDVVIKGVPGHSRVARVIAEADYRMKLIGIDKVDAGPNIPSFFDLLPLNLQQNPPAMDALRWWLTMKYDAVLHSADRQVFEIQGSSVLCQSENEFINSQGQRVNSGKAEATNRLFAQNFTRNYAELAAQDVVFADLQNLFDLSLVAALIQREQLDHKVGWDRGVFLAGGGYEPQRYEPPTAVMSVVNHRVYNGRDVIIQVAGGVRADLMAVVNNGDVLRQGARVDDTRYQSQVRTLPRGRWWWDAR